MKHYKDSSNNLFGFDEGSNIPDGLVEISIDEVKQIVADKAEQNFASLSYDKKRATEYPSIFDQLDTLYHGGYDAWKATIQAVKDKYPKEQA
jgi:hypothetical protein